MTQPAETLHSTIWKSQETNSEHLIMNEIQHAKLKTSDVAQRNFKQMKQTKQIVIK